MAKLNQLITEEGMNKAREDHAYEYEIEEGKLLINTWGFYTVEELEMKLTLCKEANKLFQQFRK